VSSKPLAGGIFNKQTNEDSISSCVQGLVEFCGMISHLFRTTRFDATGHAHDYLRGLTSTATRKNMERMVERVDSADYEGMQHFLSGSPWDASAVFDWIAVHADERLGGHPESMLIIDESGNTKKGKMSVGVAHQYNGRLGKTDNCQVGVYSVLNCGEHSALIGAKLFLPDEWVQDPERCDKAGIPKDQREPQTKIQLARKLIEDAMRQGVRFGCTAVDAFYGRDQNFLQWMDSEGLIYCADVPANTLVFEKEPSGETRPAKMKQAAMPVADIGERWAKTEPLPEEKIILREGENGLVVTRASVRRVWVWPSCLDRPRECWLIMTQDATGEVKTSLSNAPATATLRQLTKWQAGRYFVERTFQDAKSHAGMGQYQARGWRAWHHHMAMVALAILFLTEQRLLLGSTHPLISAADIVELLDWHLRSRFTEADMLAIIAARHQQRARNALNAQNRQRQKHNLPPVLEMQVKSLPK
jgi:SRSO17 transposase